MYIFLTTIQQFQVLSTVQKTRDSWALFVRKATARCNLLFQKFWNGMQYRFAPKRRFQCLAVNLKTDLYFCWWKPNTQPLKLLYNWSLTNRWFSIISRKLIAVVLPLCWNAAGVFYSQGQLGCLLLGIGKNYHKISAMLPIQKQRRTFWQFQLLLLCSLSQGKSLLNRLVPTNAKECLQENHCSFRHSMITSDMIFVHRQLQQKYQEQNRGLFVTFVVLMKIFDTVGRGGMIWKQTTKDPGDGYGFYIRYHIDGILFNLRQLQTYTKTLRHLVRDHDCAYDTALVAHTEKTLLRIISRFSKAGQLFGQEVSLKKTGLLHQPVPREDYNHPHVIAVTELKKVYQFTYLGYTITSDDKINKKSTTNCQRRTEHLADYIKACGTLDTWRIVQRIACMDPSSLQPSYKDQSRMSFIGTTDDSSNSYTSAAFTLFLTSTRVT